MQRSKSGLFVSFVVSGVVLVSLASAGCGSSRGNNGDAGHSGLDGFLSAGDAGNEKPVDFSGIDLPPQYEAIWAHTGQTLYTVDPITYALTTIGDFGAADDMTDLAITPDGKIYTISRTAVYSVNENTGAATQLAPLTSTSNVALTFRLDGTLLAADQAGNVFIIDPTDGSSKKLGDYGADYDTAGDLVAVADGTMYGVSTKGPSKLHATTNVLIKVDTSTAVGTSVGEIGFEGVFGVAYSGGKVLAFTKTGDIIRIDPSTGAGTLVASHAGIKFYGAGTSPLVPIL